MRIRIVLAALTLAIFAAPGDIARSQSQNQDLVPVLKGLLQKYQGSYSSATKQRKLRTWHPETTRRALPVTSAHWRTDVRLLAGCRLRQTKPIRRTSRRFWRASSSTTAFSARITTSGTPNTCTARWTVAETTASTS